MATSVRPARRPDPEPMQANEVLVIGTGTGLWLLAFIVLLPLRATLHRHHTEWWLWVCVAGFALGLLGLALVTRHRRPRSS